MVSKAIQYLAISLPVSASINKHVNLFFLWSKNELTKKEGTDNINKYLKLSSTCRFDVDVFIHVNQSNGGQSIKVPQAKIYERKTKSRQDMV